MKHSAVFLDRDGVLIREAHLLTRIDELKIPAGAPESVRRLRDAGFLTIVVTNQTVIARGRASEAEVEAIHEHLRSEYRRIADVQFDAIYVCPHHPNATLHAYRYDCECRKPKPGMLFRGAEEFGIDLAASFMVGDRVSDIVAGQSAGCRTILVQSGSHGENPIESTTPYDTQAQADAVVPDMAAASDWILAVAKGNAL